MQLRTSVALPLSVVVVASIVQGSTRLVSQARSNLRAGPYQLEISARASKPEYTKGIERYIQNRQLTELN